MKRVFFSIFLFFTIFPFLNAASPVTAKDAVSQAENKSSAKEAVEYLKKTVPSLSSAADKRSGYAFLGSLQEQLGLFADAEKSYASAAAINAGDAAGMPKKSSEQLVIDATRCALSLGDYKSAESYLNSVVKNSTDEKIIAYTKLYAQWIALCKADSQKETEDAITLLKSYVNLESMKLVTPSVLLTLYHLTNEDSYATLLKNKYPASMETAIVRGSVNQLPMPFWYFVPRNTKDFIENTPAVSSSAPKKQVAPAKKNIEETSKNSNKIVKQQLGYFKVQKNAEALAEKLKSKGFNAKITEDKRKDGSVCYQVTVDENKDGTIGSRLRDAGFECSPVMEAK